MEVVSYEISKKLKEKGFNTEFKYSLGYYDTLGNFMSAADHWFLDSWIIAPTISQVLKWLREEKEIDIVIYPIDGNTVFMGGEKYILSVYINKKRDYKLHHDNIDKYVKWEQAALAGIEYVIDNLI